MSASSSSPSIPLPSPAPEAAAAAAAASFCVATENVDLQASNKLCQDQNLENIAACSRRQDNSSSNIGNIYDSIDNVPVAYQNCSASLPSLVPTFLSPSPPHEAASCSVNADNVLSLNSKPVPVKSLADGTRTSYMNMSASSPPPRLIVPLPSPPEAAASFSADTDSVDIQTGNKLNHKPEDIDNRQNNSSRNVGNVYDSIEDVPAPTYQNLSASGSQATARDETTAAAASVGVEANNVYIPPDNSIKDVPCVYQIEPNTKPSGVDYANCLQERDVGESTA